MENIFICLLTGFLLCGVIIGIIFKNNLNRKTNL
jgi:hypothetical protein